MSNTLRTNLTFNPSAAVDLTFWTSSVPAGVTNTQSRSTSTATMPDGVVFGSYVYTPITAGTGAYVDARVIRTGVSAPVVGATYMLSAYVAPTRASGPADVIIYIQWVDGSGSVLSTTTSPTFPALTGWTRLSLSGVAPTGAMSAQLIFRLAPSVGTVTVGDVIRVTGVLFEASTTVGTYFDGAWPSSVGMSYAFTGTAWASTSFSYQSVGVSAQPSFTPPRNEITVAVPTGDVMSNPTLNRIVGGVSTPLRTQPSAGFDTQIVEDYECPYGQAATYEFVTDYTNPSAYTTVWDEVWSNLTAWSGDVSQWVVAGGLLKLNSTAGAYSITRSVAPGSYRVVVSSMTVPGAYADNLASGVTLRGLVQVSPLAGGFVQIGIPGKPLQATSIQAGSPITIDCLGTSVVVSGTGGSYTLSGLTSTNFSTVQISGQTMVSGVFNVGEVKVSSYPATVHVDATSAPATLAAVNPWMVHPSNPSLSIPVGSSDASTASIRTIGDITNGSASTQHRILGQSAPITTTSGPRYSNQLTIVVGTRTAAQEQALNGLVADGTPILFRFPPTFDAGFDEGFYSVGDVTRSRFAQRVGAPRRDVTLPLTQVQAPVVNVQNNGWSWAALAATFPTWAQVAAAYDTWADVLTDNRKPGF